MGDSSGNGHDTRRIVRFLTTTGNGAEARHGSTDCYHLSVIATRTLRTALQTQSRPPSRNDALDVVHDLPPGAKASQKYLWGVWHGDTMIGFIEAIRHWPQAHYVYIGQLMIGERWQRQGHGRAVLGLLAERSRSWAGVRRWRLAVVACQTSALAFWKSAGFVETGQREASPFYRAPLVLMEKVVGR